MATNMIFKGDLAEVSLAKETGLIGHGTGTWVDGTTTTDGWKSVKVGPTTNTSTIHVGEGMYWVDTGGDMKVPVNMLIGATLRIYDAAGDHSNDHYTTTLRTFYITANDADTITIQPRLASADASGSADAYFIIDNLRVPTFDASCATGSDERIKADQFLGLLNSFTLPESEIDVRKQHIVGMGRDVNVLTSGKETLAGGAYDLNAHSLRFLKYALGGHTAKSMGEYAQVLAADTVLTAKPLNFKNQASQVLAAQFFGTPDIDNSITAISNDTITGLVVGNVGQDALIGGLSATGSSTTVVLDAGGQNIENIFYSGQTAGILKVLSATGLPLLGHHTGSTAASKTFSGVTEIDAGFIDRAKVAGVPVYALAAPAANVSAGDIRIDLGESVANKFSAGDYIQIFDKDTVKIPGADVTAPTLNKHEIRRVLAVGSTDGDDEEYVYVEEAFLFGHTATSCGVERMQYTWDGLNSIAWERGSPAIISGTNELKYGVEHNFFGYSYLPTFTIEQSFRQTDVTPGAEQMLRIFSGCKVNALTLKADSEGEVKISGDYEAGRMFTDTSGDFITPHRMFENTADSQVNRRVSGISVDGEKPYLFQHISIEAFGAPLLRAINAEFGISNSNTARWYIRGTDGAYADEDQVQAGAAQYASEITEAAREYTFKFSALVEDSRWFDQLRKRKHHINTNDITMTMTKPGSHATRQNALITIEDYTVTKAAHPLPTDKGPVTAEVEFAIRHLKATETSPYFTL
jgi:hypothetical protein